MRTGGTKIWLASYPRSGNTYTRLLLKHHFGMDAVEEQAWGPGLRSYECELTSGINARHGSAAYVIKTHSLVKDGSRAIVVVRDGRDALVSNVHFEKRFWGAWGSFEHLLGRMIDPQDPFGVDWGAFYEHWLFATSGPTALIRYEELVHRPLEVIWNALARVLGDLIVPRRLESLPPFSEFQRQKPGFFRSGKIGAWKEEMSPELEAKFWHYHGEMMTHLGYKR